MLCHCPAKFFTDSLKSVAEHTMPDIMQQSGRARHRSGRPARPRRGGALEKGAAARRAGRNCFTPQQGACPLQAIKAPPPGGRAGRHITAAGGSIICHSTARRKRLYQAFSRYSSTSAIRSILVVPERPKGTPAVMRIFLPSLAKPSLCAILQAWPIIVSIPRTSSVTTL